jgi:hypothetical protein
MCQHGQTRNVQVLISEDLSCTGFARFKFSPIDKCIAPLVQALQQAGINMRGSCCGHDEENEGDIHLQDGRILLVLPPEVAKVHMACRSKVGQSQNTY